MKIYENTLIQNNHLADSYILTLDNHLHTHQKE